MPTLYEMPVPAVRALATLTALPVMLMPQVPDAPDPVVLGTSRLVRAPLAVVAPVPPLSTSSVPARVIVPDVVTGPPEVVKPVVPPETLTEVTVPDPPPVLALLSRFRKNRYQSRETMPVRSSVIGDWFLGICGSLSGLGIGAGQCKFGTHDSDLDGVGARHLVHAVTQLVSHTQTAPESSEAIIAHLAHASPLLV